MSAPRRIAYRVGGKDAGVRLDLFLKERIPRMSREGIQRAIAARVAIAGRGRVRPATLLKVGEEVIVTYPDAGAAPAGVPVTVPVLHDDAHLVAVDKPAGLLVHRTASSRGPALLDALEAQGFAGLHLVHRLDRETSGVVVLARSAETARALSRAFAGSRIAKTYLAVVAGEPDRDEGVVDLPLGPAARSAIHVKQAVDSQAGRPAVTRWRVVERLPGFALVEARPLTGRRHQIRVHLRAIGHPVVGDKLYGPRESHHLRFAASGMTGRMRAELLADRHLLHAAALAIPRPGGGTLVVTAPMPADMEAFLAARRPPE